jgi:hypothetical protein
MIIEMVINNLPDIIILVLQKMTLKTKNHVQFPSLNVTTDSLGKMVRKYDKSSKRTTLINDEVRVYKGFLEIERIG